MTREHNAEDLSNLSVDQLVEQYITRFLDTPEPKVRRWAKANPVFRRLVNFNPSAKDIVSTLLDKVPKEEHEDFLYQGIEIAVQQGDNYETGLPIGWLSPEFVLEDERISSLNPQPSEELIQGVKDGQIYRMKTDCNGVLDKKKGLMGVVASAALLFQHNLLDNPLALTKPPHNYSGPLIVASLLGFMYATRSLKKSGLFANDQFISRELVTDGAFRYCRNPFYTSLAVSATLLTAGVLTGLSFSPFNVLAGAAFVASILRMRRGYRQYVIQDELILERTFGQPYLDYKERTPRYFPAFWKLFQRDNRPTPTE